MRNRHNYEEAAEYKADAYEVSGYRGIAWHVLGWETEPDEDTEWSGYENRTGNLICVMVGDDRHHSIDPSDLSPIEEGDYCPSCGQTGCHYI